MVGVGRARVRIGAVLLVAILAAACSESGSSTASSAAPTLPDATSGAGTKLPDGFTVAPGSVLLGPVLRTSALDQVGGVPIPEHGWRAVFLVSGDPYQVLDHVRADAARVGIRSEPVTCTTYPDPGTFRCEGGGASGNSFGTPRSGARFIVTFERHRARKGVPPASHLLLGYSRIDSTAPATPVPAPTPSAPTEKAPPFPADWPALLEVGDRIPAPALSSPINNRKLVVEPGMRAVGPIVPFNACGTGGFVGVFEVTGDPRRVIDGYARQFGAIDFYPQRDVWAVNEAEPGPSALYYGNGEGTLEAQTIERPDEPTYLQVAHCND